jgi:hypothetical protein
MITREDIYAGLFDHLKAIPGLVVSSRILRHWADVPPEQQPALFQAQVREQPHTITGEDCKWMLDVDVYVYVRTDGDVVPGSVLNPLLDAIEAAMPLHPVTGKHTLSVAGVEWARINGAIETDEGTLGQQAVAIVPIQILAA